VGFASNFSHIRVLEGFDLSIGLIKGELEAVLRSILEAYAAVRDSVKMSSGRMLRQKLKGREYLQAFSELFPISETTDRCLLESYLR